MDHCDAISGFAKRQVRILGWLTIALAVAPISSLLFPVAVDAILPREPVSPWGDLGAGASLGVLIFLAIVHVPYTLLLCLTAQGLFRHRPWAHIIALALTVPAFILILFLGGAISVVLYNLLVEKLRDRSLMYGLALFLPLLLTCFAYCLMIHLWLWKRPVRELFYNPSPAVSA